MASNFLNFNKNKTEVIMSGPSGDPSTSHFNLRSLEPFIKSHAKNFGVRFNSNFTLENRLAQLYSEVFSN